ncbi:hypothetical protein TNCV_2725981 [Trichonephila clavipes]|nr:hypothetical protein TNCV_2725981 [Trichonephila clavipes]
MYVREVLEPEVVSFLQGIPGAIFQQDNSRTHNARNVVLFNPTHTTSSPNMSPIEHVWDLMICVCLWNSLPTVSQKGTLSTHRNNMEFRSTSRLSTFV